MSHEIVIVGAGLSGTLMAMELVRQGSTIPSILLIGQDDRPGLGLAYGTRDPAHLLNTPAGKMGLFADDPEHFVKWLARRKDSLPHQSREPFQSLFVPRAIYGTYIQETWLDHVARAEGRLLYKQDTVIDLEDMSSPVFGSPPSHKPNTRFKLSLRSGQSLDAQQVILALGFALPQTLNVPVDPPDLLGKGYIANPWDHTALDHIGPMQRVLLVGTGLTACDVMQSLLRRGHAGEIVAVSRHGLLPAAHAEYSDMAAAHDALHAAPSKPGLVERIRDFRRLCDAAEAAGSNWRAVFDSMRPFLSSIWQSFSMTEQQRFLRHMKTFWNVHRHRIPPQVMQVIHTAKERGQIRIHKGQLAKIAGGGAKRFAVELKSLDHTLCLSSDWIINCTGPSTSLLNTTSPLLKAMLRRRFIKPHPLGLGLSIHSDDRVMTPQDLPIPGLYALGPLCMGHEWESTAVPEIRTKAQYLAATLASSKPKNTRKKTLNRAQDKRPPRENP